MSLERFPPTEIRQNNPKHAFAEWLVRRYVTELSVEGLENLELVRELRKQGKPVIFSLNHMSHADAAAFDYSLKVNGFEDIQAGMRYVMGTALLKHISTRFLVSCYNGIFVASQRLNEFEDEKRKEFNRRALMAAGRAFDEGNSLGVFFEGTRLDKMKEVSPSSAYYLYLRPDTFVVSAAVWGTELVHPRGKWIPNHGRVDERIGRPIAVAEFAKRVGEYANEEEKRARMVAEVMLETAMLLPEKYRGAYSEIRKN